MVNERKTEIFVREKLRELGFLNDENIVVEEQKSDNEVITNLLSKASKSGNGAGYPEFIITSKNSDVLIVIECKAHIKNHESEKKDKPKDFAVDGVLHYASFLKDKFHIIAIGVSGDEKENRISTYQWNKEDKRYFFRKFSDFQKYEDYFEVFHAKDKVVLSEDELMQYAKKLHDQMRDEVKLKEAEKPLLVAALLLALDNDDFVREIPTIINPKKLANRIIESISESLEKSGILKSKIETLIGEFSFIKTQTYLTSGEIDHNNPSHDNNSLHKFLIDIQNKVYPFVKKVNNIDIIGKFYSEFLRYTGGDGKGLGIVLTPTHITDLFCDLAEVNKNSKVLDICTGTGGFLISAMKKMIENDPTVAEIDYIYKNSLVGVETQTNMFALAVANMIIRGDGKTNMFQSNVFDIKTQELQKFGCNVGLINPPYSQKKEGEEELSFVLKLLDSMSVGGIGIAIIPIKCTNNDNEIRRKIFEKHSLKAVMIMPSDLFKGAGTHTCIMIFEANKPHNPNIPSWFALWENDGYVNYKNQRLDRFEKWENIKNEWLNDYFSKTVKTGFSVLQKVNYNNEWSAYGYVETNYSNLTKNNFKKTVKDFISYQIRKEYGDISDYDLFSVIMENENLVKLFKKENDDDVSLETNFWKEYQIKDLFDIKGSKTTPKLQLIEGGEGKYPYVTTRASNNAVDGFYNIWTDKGNILTIDSATVGYCSYQSENFSASDHVEKLIPKFEMNTYIALFLQTIINLEQFRYSYGRKFNQERIKKTKIKLPFKNGEIDFIFMEEFIKSLP
ncbi:MAG: N-6 DNA methylase, partial [Candidatus Gracilibacteria bacterium]|nr:N-6 DNA methylase [Candidatus Gracilibacteria bacterium]